MITFSPEAIAAALNAGHQDPRFATFRKDCTKIESVRAKPCPRKEPGEPNLARGAKVRAEQRPGAAERYRRKADRRNRARVDKAVAAASDLPEPHPELTAQTIHGCRVLFCESAEYEEPVSISEWWRMIARPGFE